MIPKSQGQPGRELPDDDIVVVHRSDGSGTTYILTDFLSKVSPDWKSKVGTGTSVNWPVGLGGKGNEGVTGLVKQTPGRDRLHRADLCRRRTTFPTAKCKMPPGNSSRRTSPALPRQPLARPRTCPTIFAFPSPTPRVQPPTDFKLHLALIPAQIHDAAKRDAIKDFLKWMLTDGQKYNEGSVLRTAAQAGRRQRNRKPSR